MARRPSPLPPGAGWERVIDFPAAIRRGQCASPFRHRRDGQQRIDAQRPWNHRSIANIQPLVRGLSRVARKRLPLVIHYAVLGRVSHYTTAQRVHGHQLLIEQFAPHRIDDVRAVQRLGGVKQRLADFLEDRLAAHSRPGDLQAVFARLNRPSPPS